jgi:hypothetical protein
MSLLGPDSPIAGKHFASMTKQDAHIFEILVTQMRQYRDIDTVSPKRSAYPDRPTSPQSAA